MAQQMLLSKHATCIYVDDFGYTNIVFHNTCIVRFNYKEIILNSGSWLTSTTKTRMNQASNQFKLGFKVYQKKFRWFVDTNSQTRDFYDGIILDRGSM